MAEDKQELHEGRQERTPKERAEEEKLQDLEAERKKAAEVTGGRPVLPNVDLQN